MAESRWARTPIRPPGLSVKYQPVSTDTSGSRGPRRVVAVCQGSAGSDCLLINTPNGSKQRLETVSLGDGQTPTRPGFPFREVTEFDARDTVVSEPPIHPRYNGRSEYFVDYRGALTGDRIWGEDHALCAMRGVPKYSLPGTVQGTRMMVFSTEGDAHKMKYNQVFAGSLTWMQDTMAFGNMFPTNPRDPKITAHGNDRMILFDIARGGGEITAVSRMRLDEDLYFRNGVVNIVAIQPKVALASTTRGFYVADMRTCKSSGSRARYVNGLSERYPAFPGNGTLAGSRAFFTDTPSMKEMAGLYEATGENRSKIAVLPLAGAGAGPSGGINRVYHSYGLGEYSIITSLFSWHAAHRYLGVVTRRYPERKETVHLLDTRRHVGFEIPGATSFAEQPAVDNPSLVNSSIISPTHACGIDAILLVPRSTGEAYICL